MANKMRAKLVLELRQAGMSRRSIAKTRNMSMHTVMSVFDAADELDIGWEDVRDLTNDEVIAKLFPRRAEEATAVAQPDYDDAHAELRKAGVTLKLLWEEYAEECREKGSTAISYSSFTRGYADYVTAKNVTNHLEHKPGQAMEVDWSGACGRTVDAVTGEASKAYLFVAVLPCSQYTYVEATADMKQTSWLACHINAYEFFGGVAARLVCDNLKTGVTAHPRNGEVVLNESYEALARHYGSVIMPTGVRKPKQKASVEGAVGKIAQAIIGKLRNEVFHSLRDLNAAIREELGVFNEAPFQKRDGSRRSAFDEVEKGFLAPLPLTPYEIAEWVYKRSVNLDFHVVYKTNRYSVPYGYVGKKVDLKVTDALIEVYCAGERIATHRRFPEYVRYRHATLKEHMPPEFANCDWDDARMLRWAASIGPSTRAVVQRLFGQADIKEQAYSPVMAVLNLTRQYGDERLELACRYALERVSVPRCRVLRSILASGVADARGASDQNDEGGPCGYVRGGGYYGGDE